MRSPRILSPLLLAAVVAGVYAGNVCAQVGGSSSSSSSSSTTTEATIKGYSFKYKEKFDTYSGQIEMGVTKGWLTAAQAETFKTRLAELRSVESAAAHNGYSAPDIANLDKLTTKFNEDLSSASSKAPATTGSATDAASTDTKAAAAKSTTKKTTTKKTTTKKTK